MTVEQLRKAQYSKPFQPFDICLADGQRIPVPSREFLWLPPQASRTFIAFRTPEAYQIVDLLLVTSLDFMNGRAATPEQSPPKRVRRDGSPTIRARSAKLRESGRGRPGYSRAGLRPVVRASVPARREVGRASVPGSESSGAGLRARYAR